MFKKISWFEMALECNKDKSYYIKGTVLEAYDPLNPEKYRKDHYYGPYTVHNANRRMMMNLQGNTFMHYAEDFYILEKEE